MEEQRKTVVTIAEEQLDALVQSLLPAMKEFFSSEKGKQIWTDHLCEIEQGRDKVA